MAPEATYGRYQAVDAMQDGCASWPTPLGLEAFEHCRAKNDVRDAADLADLADLSRMGRCPRRGSHPRPSRSCVSWCVTGPGWSACVPIAPACLSPLPNGGSTTAPASRPPATTRSGSASGRSTAVSATIEVSAGLEVIKVLTGSAPGGLTCSFALRCIAFRKRGLAFLYDPQGRR